MKAIKERMQTLAPIVKGSCQPSKARVTEGLKATSKNQARYRKATLSSFRHSAFCILPQSHLPLRREGRERAAQPTFLIKKKTKMGKNNPSVAAALPRRATSPDSGEADCLYALWADLHQTLSKDYRPVWLPLSRGAVSRVLLQLS